MRTLKTKVGNLKIIVKEESNFFNDFSVMVLNGSDIIAQDIYTGGNLESVTSDILKKFDYYTKEYLVLYYPQKIEFLSENTLKIENDYFCRVDDTRFFKHFIMPVDGWTLDKFGKRIIDR